MSCTFPSWLVYLPLETNFYSKYIDVDYQVFCWRFIFKTQYDLKIGITSFPVQAWWTSEYKCLGKLSDFWRCGVRVVSFSLLTENLQDASSNVVDFFLLFFSLWIQAWFFTATLSSDIFIFFLVQTHLRQGGLFLLGSGMTGSRERFIKFHQRVTPGERDQPAGAWQWLQVLGWATFTHGRVSLGLVLPGVLLILARRSLSCSRLETRIPNLMNWARVKVKHDQLQGNHETLNIQARLFIPKLK